VHQLPLAPRFLAAIREYGRVDAGLDTEALRTRVLQALATADSSAS
jgi:hypothetical protein